MVAQLQTINQEKNSEYFTLVRSTSPLDYREIISGNRMGIFNINRSKKVE